MALLICRTNMVAGSGQRTHAGVDLPALCPQTRVFSFFFVSPGAWFAPTQARSWVIAPGQRFSPLHLARELVKALGSCANSNAKAKRWAGNDDRPQNKPVLGMEGSPVWSLYSLGRTFAIELFSNLLPTWSYGSQLIVYLPLLPIWL